MLCEVFAAGLAALLVQCGGGSCPGWLRPQKRIESRQHTGRRGFWQHIEWPIRRRHRQQRRRSQDACGARHAQRRQFGIGRGGADTGYFGRAVIGQYRQWLVGQPPWAGWKWRCDGRLKRSHPLVGQCAPGTGN